MKTQELEEPVLADDYPVYFGYIYVMNGNPRICPLYGTGECQSTISDLKRAWRTDEIRRCDMTGRGMER